jgi:Leucine Rich Repeat
MDLSDLPDDCLAIVLSFLSLKQVMQMCFRFKNWTRLWSFVSDLKFDIEDWVDVMSNDVEELAEGERRFERFLCNVLDKREPTKLNMFEYRNIIFDYSSEVSLEFFNRVAPLLPQIVCFDIARVNQLELPDSIFSCASLEELVLSIYTEDIFVVRPNEINLPSLRTLKLKGVRVSDDDGFTQKLFSGCPALQSLVFEDCRLDIADLSSDRLKKLILDECLHSRRTRISCPKLIAIDIDSSDEVESFELENLTSLEYANLCLEDIGDDVSLLGNLSNVSRLDIGLCGEFKVYILYSKMIKLNSCFL